MSSKTRNTQFSAAVELCCGMGGIGIGLDSAGYEVVRAYDSWAPAINIYNYNAPKEVAMLCDILSDKGYADIVRDRRRLGEIDLLATGPPCKGFSQIRNGHDNSENPHNRVILSIPKYVAIFRPRLVLIENVPELMRHCNGKTFRSLLAELERPGPRHLHYCVQYGIYDAALYGAPQARRRILILAVREGSGNERLPNETPNLSSLFSALRHGREVPDKLTEYAIKLADPDNISLTTGLQALSDLPVLGPGEPKASRPYATTPTNAYQRAMRHGAPNLVSNTQTPSVRPETVERLKLIPPGGCVRNIPKDKLNGLTRRYGSAYRRLHPDAPSTTLSTKYDCVYHYKEHRSLSVREYARLQGIPDRISFPEELLCRRHVYEMIGNSVPPMLIYGILTQMDAFS